MSATHLRQWVDTWLGAVADDNETATVGRFSSFEVSLISSDGGPGLDLSYRYGTARADVTSPADQDAPAASRTSSAADRLVLSAPRAVWTELAAPAAQPRRHDLLSLIKAPNGIEVVAGRDVLVRQLPVLTRLVKLAKNTTARRCHVGTPPQAGAPTGANPGDPALVSAPTGTDIGANATPQVEDVLGRYVRLRSGGDEFRIYFEEAGPANGPALLALHTAGADARQFRHLLADTEVTRRYRTVAFDLPAHGKSSPPDDWWQRDYLLRTEHYATLVTDVADALGLDRPVVLGCSMAGSLVLELARRDPVRWRAVIGLSGALKLAGRFQDWPLHPDVNAHQAIPMWTASLMAPQSPEAARREVQWAYGQGGPGVYRGDTYFYSEDFDLRESAGTIDTRRCPVYLLTGEYDHACTPDDTAAARDAIPGARGCTMPGIGHFPMAENYPLFRTYLLSVLDELDGVGACDR